jgi:putative NADH-flavin reductase
VTGQQAPTPAGTVAPPARLVVFGATGGTGREIVRQALAAGSTVTALVRRPEAMDVRHPVLTVVAGDVLRPEDARRAVGPGAVVISALGVGYSRKATTLYSAGTGNVLAAMHAASARRLVCLSTSALEVSPVGGWFQRAFVGQFLQRVVRRPYDDMRRMEELVRGGDIDWTIVRAAKLTNRTPTGRYRAGPSGALPAAWSIGRADLATYLLSLPTGPATATYRRTVEIAY